MDLLSLKRSFSESEFVLSRFDENFSAFKGKNIVLVEGSLRDDIMTAFNGEYRFIGVISEDGSSNEGFLSLDEALAMRPDIVILCEHRYHKETDYHLVEGMCRDNGIALFDCFGVDELALHDEVAGHDYLNFYQWLRLLKDYDVISFSAMYTVLYPDSEREKGYSVNNIMKNVIDRLRKEGKTVLLSLREKFGLDLQKEILSDANLLSGADHIYIRDGADLGYSLLRERWPEAKIIHIGTDIVGDVVIPRAYGLDSHRFVFRDVMHRTDEEKDSAIKISRPSLRAVKERIDGHDIVSFDIFDTLLNRSVPDPDDVFSVIETKSRHEGFAQARIMAERTCHGGKLDDIYREFEKITGQNGESLKMIEKETEDSLITLREPVAELVRYALGQKKKVILVSDMYFDSGFLEKLLHDRGLEGFERIFVSCEYGRAKESGLYDIVKDTYPGMSILHIGDDPESDIAAAESALIDAIYIPTVRAIARTEGFEEIIADCASISDLMLVGTVMSEVYADPFNEPDDTDKVARGALPSINIGYLSFLVNYFREDSFDTFLLQARDGWHIRSTYELLRKRFAYLPKGIYYHTSRRAAFLLVADMVDYSDSLTLRYSDDQVAILDEVYGLKGMDYSFDPEKSLRENTQANMELIAPICTLQRANFEKYIEKKGIEKGSRIAIMDFISSGSTQRFLSWHIGCDVTGVFYAFPEYMYDGEGPQVSYFGYDRRVDYPIQMVLEKYMTAPQGATDGYDRLGEPVFADEIRSESEIEHILKVQSIAEKLEQRFFSSLYCDDATVSAKVVNGILEACIARDTFTGYYDDWIGEEYPSD